MFPRLPLYLLTLLPVLLVQSSTTSSPSAVPADPPPRPPSPAGDPTWALGLRLYRAVRSEPGSVNALFSPLLVASSLGALAEGSAGTTARQVQDLLRTPSSSSSSELGNLLSSAFKSFTKANGTAFHLHASSGIFSKQAPSVSEAFVKEIQARFGLQHAPLGRGDAQADLKQLHAWAQAGLGGLEGAALEAETQAKAGALILANALRFKGLWEREFGVERTERRTFLGREYTKVTMMHRAGLYRLYEDVSNMVQVLEVPLWRGEASVVLLLPFHVERLDRLERLLSPELLAQWLEQASVTSVAVSLPRVNVSSALSLRKPLSALGLADAWDPKMADLSGASGEGGARLHLGAVLHWASVELDAQAGRGSVGEEAVGEEAVEKPRVFYADHPFLVLVRDRATGALLLLGAVDHADGEPLHDEL
ncbi:serine (or cysteine) peptidase inhibitor, clade H, member 2 isoform X2 [Betta splendens]|nr:serine (or cysteine) peptidase inhibitor, clade H, member 2 isoform X2 [Betta splendens]XP_028992711.1 serine (or cysteine) peptidase inhibitor, clade H, member 2 isoform X2 [Betta splendens]XP_028992721.1 serine (or cysteine) peptidase inhibitor, clade H, member 2 isoform X2 [Betta splendens]XP_055360840.1 serine (or cysteine) peptidase inhibitor, clade H, member 2 isoform X2 [Betta splendens]